jgi:hypothetical protein
MGTRIGRTVWGPQVILVEDLLWSLRFVAKMEKALVRKRRGDKEL